MGSVRNGFKEVSEDAEVVAVHDGARSLVTPEIIRAVIEEATDSGAAVPAVQVKDTLKKVTNKQMWISDTPARSAYWAAQTPQCYRREVLEEALNRFPDARAATDESQLVEKCGQKVRVVPSSYENFKITTPEDLVMAEALLEQRQGGRRRIAVGFGFDIHRLVEGRELWLAGVKLAGKKGLLGHSDADAVLHAAADAVLGAFGGGEIGVLFPPDEPKWKDIASKDIVAEVIKRLKDAGGSVSNLDVTIVAGRAQDEAALQGFPFFRGRGFRHARGAGQRQGQEPRGPGRDRQGRGHRLPRRGHGPASLVPDSFRNFAGLTVLPLNQTS